MKSDLVGRGTDFLSSAQQISSEQREDFIVCGTISLDDLLLRGPSFSGMRTPSPANVRPAINEQQHPFRGAVCLFTQGQNGVQTQLEAGIQAVDLHKLLPGVGALAAVQAEAGGRQAQGQRNVAIGGGRMAVGRLSGVLFHQSGALVQQPVEGLPVHFAGSTCPAAR